MVKLLIILLTVLNLTTGVKIEKVGNQTTVTIGNMSYRYHDELIK